MEDAESTASGTLMGATMLLASSLDVRKYALGLSRLRRGRYECDCAYRAQFHSQSYARRFQQDLVARARTDRVGPSALDGRTSDVKPTRARILVCS